jgi:hypothetical protein
MKGLLRRLIKSFLDTKHLQQFVVLQIALPLPATKGE